MLEALWTQFFMTKNLMIPFKSIFLHYHLHLDTSDSNYLNSFPLQDQVWVFTSSKTWTSVELQENSSPKYNWQIMRQPWAVTFSFVFDTSGQAKSVLMCCHGYDTRFTHQYLYFDGMQILLVVPWTFKLPPNYLYVFSVLLLIYLFVCIFMTKCLMVLYLKCSTCTFLTFEQAKLSKDIV